MTKPSIVKKFELDANNNFVYQWLEVAPSPNNPESTVNEKWKNYKLTEEDFARGYVDIDGLRKTQYMSSTYAMKASR